MENVKAILEHDKEENMRALMQYIIQVPVR